MKKTVNISLGGMVFCVEEDAYFALDAYLKRLERSFASESDRREILNDIEARIAEHFKENHPTANDVINREEVNRVIGIMGEPTDFEESNKSGQRSRRPFQSSGRRLYRDGDNNVIGGVCSGLAYFWNMDPVLIRVLFVIVALWGGGGVFVYIILWIVIPEARTAAERLEMTGEAVTAENIGRSFTNSGNQRK